MLDRLARLADRRARLVVVAAVAVFAIAAALGSGVADRLVPYDASDPDSESNQAQDRLEQAGYRSTGVIVLIDADPTTADGRERIAEIADRVARDRDVDRVVGYLDTGSRDFVSRDG